MIEGELARRVNGVDLSVVYLIRSHEADPGVVMLLIVPDEECATEASCVLDAAEAFGKARLILQGLEVAFGERVVVGRVRTVMRTGHTEIGEQKSRGPPPPQGHASPSSDRRDRHGA